MAGLPLFQPIPMDITPDVKWAVAALLRFLEAQRERQARIAAERARRQWEAEMQRRRAAAALSRILLQEQIRAQQAGAQASAKLGKQIIRDYKVVRDRLAKIYAKALADKVGNVLDPNQLPAVARAVAALDAGFEAAKWIYQTYGQDGLRVILGSPEWAALRIIYRNATQTKLPQGQLSDEAYQGLLQVLRKADPDRFVQSLFPSRKTQRTTTPSASTTPTPSRPTPQPVKGESATGKSAFLSAVLAAPHISPFIVSLLPFAYAGATEERTPPSTTRRYYELDPETIKEMEKERIEMEHMATEPTPEFSPLGLSPFVIQPQGLLVRRKRKNPFVEVTTQWVR